MWIVLLMAMPAANDLLENPPEMGWMAMTFICLTSITWWFSFDPCAEFFTWGLVFWTREVSPFSFGLRGMMDCIPFPDLHDYGEGQRINEGHLILHIASAWINWYLFLYVKEWFTDACHLQDWIGLLIEMVGGIHFVSGWWAKKEFAVSTLVPFHVEYSLLCQMLYIPRWPCWTLVGNGHLLGHHSYGALSRRWGSVLCEVVDWPSFGCLMKDLWRRLMNWADWVYLNRVCSPWQ